MWMDPPETLILNEYEAHVWRADLALDKYSQTTFLQLLSPEELTRARKFRFEKDRRTFIIARGILRSLIGKYLKINPAAISFHYSRFGKPGILDNNCLRFNISHSENMVLCAFAKKFDIGVDVEFINPDIEVKDIAANFFSVNEIRNLLALPANQQTLGFFNCWTRKEAFIKAVGEGLSFPLDKFEVSLKPGEPAKLLSTDWEPNAVSKWSMYAMTPNENFVGSLAIESAVHEIKLWDYDIRPESVT